MSTSKHRKIADELRFAIASGRYAEGERLPTEAQLVEQYSTSRPTVARALRELQHEGLIDRRAGSGTYVRKPESEPGLLFGLLIPSLGETEIFEPICREMARSSQSAHHALLWPSSTPGSENPSEEAWQACQQFIARKVAGVFFAPLELTPSGQGTNEHILSALDTAQIPVVLLDRDLYPFPRRSRYDRVGIDNRAAGYIVTDHLLQHGCQRIGFFSRPLSAETVAARLAGFREALNQHGIRPQSTWTVEGDPTDPAFVRRFLDTSGIEAIVCANDLTAAQLMRSLEVLGITVPRDVRLVGVDDVKYASMLRVPLTTMRQPCAQIGAAAMRALTERVASPDLPPRDILFQCDLVVRDSCGTKSPGVHSAPAGN